jgi:hypothetical protein
MNREMSSAAQNRTDSGNCPVDGSNRRSVPQRVAAACLAAVGGNLSWVPAVKTEPRSTAMVRTCRRKSWHTGTPNAIWR